MPKNDHFFSNLAEMKKFNISTSVRKIETFSTNVKMAISLQDAIFERALKKIVSSLFSVP